MHFFSKYKYSPSKGRKFCYTRNRYFCYFYIFLPFSYLIQIAMVLAACLYARMQRSPMYCNWPSLLNKWSLVRAWIWGVKLL